MTVKEAQELLKDHFGDEPIFILRAQDAATIQTLKDYRRNVEQLEGNSPSFLMDVVQKEGEFTTWQMMNRDLVKVPD